jgi:hypothetical protein
MVVLERPDRLLLLHLLVCIETAKCDGFFLRVVFDTSAAFRSALLFRGA